MIKGQRKKKSGIPLIYTNHRTHVSAGEYNTRAKGTQNQIARIGKKLGIKVV